MSYRRPRVAWYTRVELLYDATYSLSSRFTDTWEQGLHKRWTRCSTPSSYTMRSTQSCMAGSRVRHGRRPRIPHGIGDVRQRDSTSLVAIGWRGTSGHRKALPKTLASKGARKSTGDVAGQTNAKGFHPRSRSFRRQRTCYTRRCLPGPSCAPLHTVATPTVALQFPHGSLETSAGTIKSRIVFLLTIIIHIQHLRQRIDGT